MLFVGVDEGAGHILDVPGIGRGVKELRRSLHPGAGATAPGVVAVGGGHHDDGPGGIVGERRDVGLDFADAFAGVSIAVAQNVVGGNRNHVLDGAGFRVDVLDLVELIGEGGDVPGGVAGIGFAVPPAVVDDGAELVGLVRGAGEDAIGAFGVRLGVVAGAGAGDMVAGNDDPFVALVDKDVDQMAAVGHFGREETLGVVGEIAVTAPRLPPGLLEYLELLAKNFLG